MATKHRAARKVSPATPEVLAAFQAVVDAQDAYWDALKELENVYGYDMDDIDGVDLRDIGSDPQDVADTLNKYRSHAKEYRNCAKCGTRFPAEHAVRDQAADGSHYVYCSQECQEAH